MTRLILIALTLLTACAPVYVPNVRNSPMFTKAGEFQASMQFGNGFEAQSAFAVTDHFGLMTNYSYVDRTGVEEPDDYLRHRFFEGGLGYFSGGQDSFFEVFAGYGKGRGSTYNEYEFFGNQAVTATGKYERYFLQPAFGVNKRVFDFAFVSRFSLVDFYEFSNEVSSRSIREEPKFFFEPALVARINFARNHMFALMQTGASVGLSENTYFDHRAFAVSMGLGFRLGGARELVSRL